MLVSYVMLVSYYHICDVGITCDVGIIYYVGIIYDVGGWWAGRILVLVIISRIVLKGSWLGWMLT